MSPTKEETEQPRLLEVVKSARVATGYEMGAGLGLLGLAVVIPILMALWWGRPSTFAELTSLVFLGIYIFVVVATFSIILLWGLGRLEIPDSFMKWLGGATIGEVAGLLLYVLKQVFKV